MTIPSLLYRPALATALVVTVALIATGAANSPAADGDDADLTLIRPAPAQGTVSGLWLDRGHPEARQLLPHTTVVLAELKGPAAITNLRVTTDQWMHPDWAPRGLVLEIFFDGATEPAVMSPVPDFFADGSNGRAMNFSSRFLEKVPIAYNSYFRMPFRSAAKVQIRNDSDHKYMGYSMVEWEALPNLDANAGYFHATWRRKGFYITGDTREEFFRVKGRGHMIGRQYSIATREHRFSELYYVCEGNSEIDIDGRARAMEYLGSEDSFTFSWGYHRGTFIGPHAGCPYYETLDQVSRVSMYRFHDHMPIRFNKELAWFVDWTHEAGDWSKIKGWADFATVHYWYQDTPGGFRHEPLPPLNVRNLDVLPEPGK